MMNVWFLETYLADEGLVLGQIMGLSGSCIGSDPLQGRLQPAEPSGLCRVPLGVAMEEGLSVFHTARL